MAAISDRARAAAVDLVSFDQAISTAHFISLHMPHTPATSNIFNDQAFSKMKHGVRIINVAHSGGCIGRALDNGAVAQECVAVEIAEAVVGALRGELSATAVNAQMVSAEAVSRPVIFILPAFSQDSVAFE